MDLDLLSENDEDQPQEVQEKLSTPWTDAEDEKIREQWEDVKDMESRCQVLCLEDVRHVRARSARISIISRSHKHHHSKHRYFKRTREHQSRSQDVLWNSD